MGSRVLTVTNLKVTLEEQTVIEHLNLEVEAGENLAIIGPNGSGKTVFLKTLLGLVPYEGEVIWAPSARLGYVPQKVEVDLHLPLTLKNLLDAKAQTRNLSNDDVKSVIETVELPSNILNTPVGHLSGGQFQKALICFSLLGKPNVLLFDEPTASLDQLAEEHIYELIHNLQVRDKITVIVVSHDLSVVYQYATKVLCLNRTKFCFGAPKDLSPELLEKVYGAPLKHYQHEHY